MILLVTGARALADTEEATTWAQRILGVALLSGAACSQPRDPMDAAFVSPVRLVLTGGCPTGPDRWAEELAEGLEIPWTSYALDGHRYSRSGQGTRWRAEEGACANPHERNRFMIAGLRKMADAGKRVNVCALLASWSQTNGARRTAEWALEAKLGVSWHELYAQDYDGKGFEGRKGYRGEGKGTGP